MSTGAANAGTTGAGAAGGAAAGGTPAANSGGVGPAAGAQGAGAGASAAGSTASGTGTNPGLATDWTTSLNDDYKGFVQNKGWKAPTDVLESYKNLEKLVGAPQDQIIRMPKEDDPAAWDSVYSRLGRPATPDGYKLEVPKEGGSPEFAKWASEQFHKAGLSEKQGQNVVKAWNEYVAGQTTAVKDAYNAKVTADKDVLRKEWGAAHDQNVQVAQRAAREFGVDAKVIDAMEKSVGFAATMKFFQNLGTKVGEASYVAGNAGGNPNGPLTPAQAKERIKNLQSDPGFARKYMEGGHKERTEMEMLHKFAFPDVG